MKKNSLILLLAMLASVFSAQSQTREISLLDSVIVQKIIDKQAEKITFDYNIYGAISLQTHYQKGNKQLTWLPNRKSEKRYNSQHKETTAISSSFNKEKNAWNEVMKSETQYTGSVQTIVSIRESGNWSPILKSESSNNQSITISSRKNNQWIFSDKYETFLNEQGYESTSFISSIWNESTGTWKENTHSETTFNENGKWVVSALYHNNKNQQAIHIQYDNKDRLSLETRYQWNEESKDWTESQKIEYQYDAENRLIETIESRWLQSPNLWMEYQKTEYQYTDNETLPTTVILSDWSDIWIPTTEYSYFYSSHWVDIESIRPQTQLRIYPNPVNDWFQVSGLTGNAVLNVLNINGQGLIYQNIQENEAVSAQSLPEGVYIVTIQTGENTVSQKIIKK